MISSFCNWGECCSVTRAPGGVYVSRQVTGDGANTVRLRFTYAEFRAFVQGVKAGEFDEFTEEPGQ
jgi:hypothetical protein